MPEVDEFVTASSVENTFVNVAGDTMSGDLDVQGKNPYPIGGIYFQLPDEAAPDTLFVGVWENISSSYAGVFFRVEGGEASAFGSGEQADEIKSHSHIQYTGGTDDKNFSSGTGQYPPGDAGGYNNTGLSVGATGGIETRPVNMTMRVWKRVS